MCDARQIVYKTPYVHVQYVELPISMANMAQKPIVLNRLRVCICLVYSNVY